MAQDWIISGRITTEHLLPELTAAFGEEEPLAGVQVRLSARSRTVVGWGWWNSWGTVTSDADGGFRFRESHGSDRRQFKVEICFDSDRLRIKEGGETSVQLDPSGFPREVSFDLTDKDWHEIHNDDDGAAANGRMAGVTDLGDLRPGRLLVRQHADLWHLYTRTFDALDGLGRSFGFDRSIVAKYPMSIANNAAASASYSNPVNGHVYLKGDEFAARTALHELMHQWAFDRSTGEDAMAWQLAKHGSTHRPRESTTFVPFHEAFADWAAYQILALITDNRVLQFLEDASQQFPNIPFNRAHLGAALGDSERFLANVDFTERGWQSLFALLVHPMIDRLDFNRPLSDDHPSYAFVQLISGESCVDVRTGFSFAEVLDVFNTHPNRGVDRFMGNDDLDFAGFLGRAQAVLPEFTDSKRAAVRKGLNPAITANPCPAVWD